MIAKFTLHTTGQVITAELKEIEKNIIKPCDELSYYLIIWGLTKQEAKYVVKNKEGFIDKRRLLLAKKEIKQFQKVMSFLRLKYKNIMKPYVVSFLLDKFFILME